MTGTSFTVTTDAPGASRSFTVRVSSKERPVGVSASMSVTAPVNARWRPADPASTATPMLRARLTLGTTQPEPERFSLPMQKSLAVVSLPAECNLETGCTLNGTLDVELGFEGTPAWGTVEVDWAASVVSLLQGSQEVPEGYSLTLSEP
jgi:hypothetical protein